MAECSWNDCSVEAVTSVSLAMPPDTCPTCGNQNTPLMKYWMCEAHSDEYEEQGLGNNSILLINATAAEDGE